MSGQESSDHVTDRRIVREKTERRSLPRGVPTQAEQAGEAEA